jgi:hypothetical protein
MDIVSIIFFSFFLSNHSKATKIFGSKNNIVTTTIQTTVTEKEEIYGRFQAICSNAMRKSSTTSPMLKHPQKNQ